MEDIINIYMDSHEFFHVPINDKESLVKIYELLMNNTIITNPSNVTEIFYLGTYHLINRAMEYYQKGLELNDPMTICRIANIYSHPDFKYKKNFGLALEYFNKLADQDIEHALINLGDIYSGKKIGFNVKINIELASEYYKKAMKHNGEYTFFRLSEIHNNNKEKKTEYDLTRNNIIQKNIQCYLNFLNNNNNTHRVFCFALYHVGKYYEYTEKDQNKAIEYYEKAANLNYSCQKTESRVHIKKIIENYNVNWTFPSHKFWIDVVNKQFKTDTMLLLLLSKHRNTSKDSYVKSLFNKNIAISIIGQLAILYKIC